MANRIQVAVVDDDPEIRALLHRVLGKSGFTTAEATSGAEAMALLGRQAFDVALVDIKLPDASGLDILRWARESEVDSEFVVLTGNADVETAVEAMRLGAYDFVTKPWRNAELVEIIGKAAEKKTLRRENSALKEVMTRRDGMPQVIGQTPEMQELTSMIGRVAASESPVLVQGESGTGKERAFHVDVRIVAATNKDLNREAAEGRFRWDLFYRVSTITVPVPPLRRRRSDIPLLVQHFAAPVARGGKTLRFSAGAMERLMQYDWPGNIRELRNLIERLLILHEGDEVHAGGLPAELGSAPRVSAAEVVDTALVSLQEMERRHVERVLQATAWNKAQAARLLDVDIKTLNKKIRDFGMTRSA